MRSHCLIWCALSSVLLPVAGASDVVAKRSLFDLSLEELVQVQVVTAASGYAQNLLEAPASVSIIEAEEWEANGARTLNDAIRTLPGVQITKVQTGATKDKVTLRGLSGSFGQQVLILVDGVPINRIYDGGVFYGNRIPLIGFKRIEVVKGPGSAVYGADAFGGVINLVSYGPDEMPSKGVLRRGGFYTWEAAFSHGLKIGDSTLLLAYEYQRSADNSGKSVQSDLQSTFDRIFGTAASQTPGRFDEHYSISSLNLRWRWHVLTFDVYDWRNLGAGLGAGVAQAIDPRGYSKETSTTYRCGVDLSAFAPGQLDLRLIYRREIGRTLYNIFPSGTRLPIGRDGNIDFAAPVNLVLFTDGYIGEPSYNNNGYSADLTHVVEFNATHRLRWDIGFDRVELRTLELKNFGPGVIDGSQLVVSGKLTDVTGTPYIYVPNQSRDVWHLSLQDEWKITEELRATLGVRQDHYSDFGATTNPRLGASYRFSKEVAFKLSAGSAFRAPAFADLYSSNNPAGLGNPALQPETIRTVDAGISAIMPFAEQLQIDVSVFRYDAKRLIEFVRVPVTGVQVAQNVGTRHGQGFELSGRWQIVKGLSTDFNYSYVDEKNQWGRPVPEVARQTAYLGGHWQPNDKYHAYVGVKRVADRPRAAGDLRPSIADYYLGSAKFERRFDHLAISLSVENLLNVAAREPSNGSIADDYPLAGRQWMLETSWTF